MVFRLAPAADPPGRAVMSGLSIHLDSVKATPRSFRLSSGAEWWGQVREQLSELPVRLSRGFVLELEGYRLGARLLFRGEVRGAVELVCGRCAEAYVHEFRQPIELLLEPAPSPEEVGDTGLVLDPEESGVGVYAGEEVDFTPALVETLALEWPMQPRCTKQCLGLCPQCGTNRNMARCECAAGPAAQPFAELGQLLETSRRSPR